MRREERLNDREESLRLVLESQQSAMWTATPGFVVAVDLAAQTVSIQPAIQGKQSFADGTVKDVDLPLLVDVPIVWPRAGGFALTLPVAVGDEVLVVFGSRCIDSWWQSGQVGVQAEARMHDLSDGFAIFGPTSQTKKLANVSLDNVQLRDGAGTTFLEITPDGRINLVAVAEVNVSAPIVNVQASSEAIVEAHTVTLTGNVVIQGGTCTIGGILFGTHVHAGVVSAPADTTTGPENG